MQIHPPHVTEAEVSERRRLGLDLHDEEWEGVYHVTPSPSLGHQRVLTGLIRFLDDLMESRGGGTIIPEFNVFRDDAAQRDYRVPDVVFVAAGRERILARDGIHGGAPDAVIEILSPRDESYAKFKFFAEIGVPEVIVVEPEERKAEIWILEKGSYGPVSPAADGALTSGRLEVAFLTLPGEPPRLQVADTRDASRRLVI